MSYVDNSEVPRERDHTAAQRLIAMIGLIPSGKALKIDVDKDLIGITTARRVVAEMNTNGGAEVFKVVARKDGDRNIIYIVKSEK